MIMEAVTNALVFLVRLTFVAFLGWLTIRCVVSHYYEQQSKKRRQEMEQVFREMIMEWESAKIDAACKSAHDSVVKLDKEIPD